MCPDFRSGHTFFVGFGLLGTVVSASFSGLLPPVFGHVLACLTRPYRPFVAGDEVFKLDLFRVWTSVCPAGEACFVRIGLFAV